MGTLIAFPGSNFLNASMTESSLFDVLMPVYIGDDPSVVKAAIESVLNNTAKPQRFVIVKDGPVQKELERYLEILENDHPYVYLCGTVVNYGLGSALNLGLDNCISDLVFRCDADDINHLERFQTQLNEFAAIDADILGCQIEEVDPDSGTKRIKRVPCTSLEIMNFSIWRNPINHMTVLFRKSKILKLGGYPNLLYKEDYGLWLMALKQGLQIHNIDKVLVTATAGDSMIKRRSNFKSIISEWYLFLLKRQVFKHNGLKTFLAFLVRVIILLLPVSLLKYLYRHLRKSVN